MSVRKSRLSAGMAVCAVSAVLVACGSNGTSWTPPAASAGPRLTGTPIKILLSHNQSGAVLSPETAISAEAAAKNAVFLIAGHGDRDRRRLV